MHIASTSIPISDLNRGYQHATMVLETHKSAIGGIVSTVRVQFETPGAVYFDMKTDFNERIAYDAFAHPTEKSIVAQHAKVFDPGHIATLIYQAQQHYAGAHPQAIKRKKR
jgi:hypothetical protein